MTSAQKKAIIVKANEDYLQTHGFEKESTSIVTQCLRRWLAPDKLNPTKLAKIIKKNNCQCHKCITKS